MEQLLNTVQPMLTQHNALIGFGTILFLYFGKYMWKQFTAKQKAAYFKRLIQDFKAKRKQQLLAMKIPDSGINQELQQQILNLSVNDIKGLLESGTVTSEQLLNFYMKRAITIGEEHQLITSTNYETALQEARKCDQLRKTDPSKCQGELFGVPMSVKDTYDIKGLPSVVACASRLDYIPNEDGLACSILKKAGAIIYVKTNVPQVAMMLETINEIYGTAQNPWDRKRTCAGSSGGEAGIVAARCSPVGIGSDIGGSIRCPAACTGIVGFKPTAERISMKGHTFYTHGFHGQQSIKCSIGPLSKHVEDSTLVMKAWLNPQYYKGLNISELDMFHVHKDWNNEEYTTQRKLKIGYFKGVDLFMPASCVQRTVMESVEALKKNGHEVVEVEMPYVNEIVDLFFSIMCGDGLESIFDMMKGETPNEFYSKLGAIYKTGPALRKVLAGVLTLTGQKRLAHSVQTADTIDSNQYRIKTAEIMLMREKVLKWASDNKLDGLLCPAFGIPAGIHKFSNELLTPVIYMGLWNTLNFCAGVVPVTVVREDEEVYNDNYNDLITKLTKQQMKGSTGLPLNVQVVTWPFQEEICLNIMKQIETNVQFHKNHPLKI